MDNYDITKYFPDGKIPGFFQTPWMSTSLLNAPNIKVPGIEKPINLDLSSLKKYLHTELERISGSEKTPEELWEILNFFDKAILPKSELQKMEEEALPLTNCQKKCKHCNVECQGKSYTLHVKHWNKALCNHDKKKKIEEPITYKCLECLIQHVPLLQADVIFKGDKWKLTHGDQLVCPRNHGKLGYSYRYFVRDNIKFLRVEIRKEHVFID